MVSVKLDHWLVLQEDGAGEWGRQCRQMRMHLNRLQTYFAVKGVRGKVATAWSAAARATADPQTWGTTGTWDLLPSILMISSHPKR